MTNSKLDYKFVEARLLQILGRIPDSADADMRKDIKSAIWAGEYNLALDDMASIYIYEHIDVPEDVLEIFVDLAERMNMMSDPEWKDTAKIIDMGRR